MNDLFRSQRESVELVQAWASVLWAWRAWQIEEGYRRYVLELATERARFHLRSYRTTCVSVDAQGRYVAEIEMIPGTTATGATEEEARENARALGLAALLAPKEWCPGCHKLTHPCPWHAKRR